MSTFDFKDGRGAVPAKRHITPDGSKGGWVATTAQVSGNARVFGDAWVFGDARVSGDARVFGNAQVSGDAWVFGNAQVSGNARVSGDAQVFGDAWVSGNARVSGNAWVSGGTSVSPIVITGLLYPVTVTDKHLRIGCEFHTLEHWKENKRSIVEAAGFEYLNHKDTLKLVLKLAQKHIESVGKQ